jgi:hypothetical protein
MIDYSKLAEDLAAAREAAEKSTYIRGDGGASNGDGCHVRLIRARRTSVEQAAKAAGLDCTKWHDGTWRFSLVPPRNHQGYTNTVKADAMVQVLSARGWDAHVHYFTD